jgi:hypothetical protein
MSGLPVTAGSAISISPSGLSCYTAALVSLLQAEDAAVNEHFRAAVRLRVRTDSALPYFSHHDRFDMRSGTALRYTGAAGWQPAREQLAADVDAAGTVIAVADTARLPWSPLLGRASSPHWILLSRAAAGWSVVDPFEGLLPEGVVQGADVVMTDRELAELLHPMPDQSGYLRARDEMALGQHIPSPPSHWYRWLTRGPVSASVPQSGHWTTDTAASLEWIADRLQAEPDLLGSWSQDLWAATRHHQAALNAGTELSQDIVDRLAAWGELPRAVRFTADSAARGRPRPGLLHLSLQRLIELERHNLDKENVHA